MILVDTSVWIDYLKGRATESTDKLDSLLRLDARVFITPQIAQELLQGVTSAKDFETLEAYLGTQSLLVAKEPWASAVRAASIYRACRARGFTVRSSNDCAIAQAAIEHEVALLHSDADFDHIAKVVPLRIY